MPRRSTHTVLTAALSAAALMAPNAFAQSLDTHEHGTAHLQIVTDNNQVNLRFESPAINLVGFEHEPRTDAQKKQLSKAVDWLENHSLIRSSDNRCELIAASVGHTLPQPGQHEDHGEHNDHEDQGHHEEHKDQRETHDEHGHHDDSDDHGSETETAHSEFQVTQTLRCDEPLDGKPVNLQLFERFSGLEQVDAAWITDTAQGGASLTPDSNNLSLSL